MEEMKNIYLYTKAVFNMQHTTLLLGTRPPTQVEALHTRAITVLHLLDKTKLLVKQEVVEVRGV